METSLALFLLLLSFLMYTKEGLTKKGVFISPVIIALLTLVRPEAVLLYVIFLIDFAVCIRANPKKIVFFVIPYLALLAPWLIYAHLHFGTVVPNTFVAKGTAPFLNVDTWYYSMFSVLKIVSSNRFWEALLVQYQFHYL